MLRINNLSACINNFDVVKKVNLEIKNHEIYLLIGKNGSGKTSLAKTIMGLDGYKVKEGNIIFKGRDITKYSIIKRAKLGLTLSWQIPPKSSIRVKDLIELLPKANLARDYFKVMNLNYDKVAHQRMDSLSGGERKKVDLIASLLSGASLFILDEPDSGIDIDSIEGLTRIIKEMRKIGAVLLISHHEYMFGIADRASIMCRGMIIKINDKEMVKKHYHEVCKKHKL